MKEVYHVHPDAPQYEDISVRDSYDECDYIYGGTDFVITDEDIVLMKAGKIINFSVNGEYGCTLAYEKEG